MPSFFGSPSFSGHHRALSKSFLCCTVGPCYLFCVCAQLCPTLCDPMDGSPPGSSLHGISQARILEWVAISYSRGSSQPKDQTCVSKVSCISRVITAKVGSPWGRKELDTTKRLNRTEGTWKAPKHASFHEFACHLHK